MARFKFAGDWKDGKGSVVQSGTITIYLAGTLTTATAYDAKTGSALTNSQTTTDDSGVFHFWVDEGDYASDQKFRVIGRKTNFKDLDSEQTDDLILFVGNISAVETLTNKSMDADNNTFSNFEIGAEVKATVVALLNMAGFNITEGGVIFLREQAEADSNVAGRGQIWVDTAAPNVLMFTDDDDTDFRLSFTPTGTGNLVLATSPTIITPTVASLTNMQHDHADAAGGGNTLVDPVLGNASGTSITLTGTTQTDTNTLAKGNILKASASFGVDAVLDSSYNVSSVDDDGTGRWGLNINTNLSDAFAVAVIGCTAVGTSAHDRQIGIDNAGTTAGTVEIICVDNNDSTTERDPDQVQVLIGGNQ